MKKLKVPGIRFKGFTDDWQRRKLGEVIISEHKGTAKASMLGTESKYLETGYLNGGEESYVDSPANVTKKDVLVLWDGSQAGTVYHGFEGALGSTLKAYTPKYSSEYLYQYLKSNQQIIFEKYRTPNIPHVIKTFAREFVIWLPSIKEQEKIGDFFKNLDNLIELHQRELELTKDLKKSMLQKMFPKKGETTPEIRFGGFTDDWRRRKFKDMVMRVSKTSSEDLLPRVEYEDIISGQGSLNKNIFNKESNKKGIKFEEGDTLFGKLRPYLKNWLLADFKGIAVGDWWVLRPIDMNKDFIYTLIQCRQYLIVANLTTGTKMPRSDWNIVSNTKFLIPSIKEQERIGVFFKNLDNLIELHGRELDTLKQAKKSLLQHMFI